MTRGTTTLGRTVARRSARGRSEWIRAGPTAGRMTAAPGVTMTRALPTRLGKEAEMLTMPSGRKVWLLDLAVLAWSVVWILVGAAVAETVGGLTELTVAFRSVGGAVGGVGEALGSVDLPLIGGALDEAGGAVSDAGRDIVARGEATRDEIERVAYLIGAVVAAIPILTLVLPYAPARAARTDEATALRRLVRSSEREDVADLERFLADRALGSVSYRRLAALTERPWELESASTRRALAEEELRRLAIDPRLLEPGPP